jgi:hypothetical protein
VKSTGVCLSRKLTVLEKSQSAIFWPGSSSSLPPSKMDRVVAADHLTFRDFDGVAVSVRSDLRTGL